MAMSSEMRKLQRKWTTGNNWSKRLEWIELDGIRGWTGQRLTFPFPIVAITGENGSGKSTLLQAAATVHRDKNPKNTRYPSEFFPKTAWDSVQSVNIRYGYLQGDDHLTGHVRKPTSRWLGHAERPMREVVYIDLSRLQPVATRVGYARIAKTRHSEASAVAFNSQQVDRFSNVMGKRYDSAKIAITDIDKTREVPVISKNGVAYSGFHQGSGETTVAELLQAQLPKNGLILIDEIESSLHPRAQRRLMRDLAERCRESDLQIIITTHSPYILEELPLEARMHILDSAGSKIIAAGVSPQFAMTKMDDENHPECDVYVEDDAAKIWLAEILSAKSPELFPRVSIVPFGSSQVGISLGSMVSQNRFPRPTCVFLDGDSPSAAGCYLLPGGDAPEQVVFNDLREKDWANVSIRISRDHSSVHDACSRALTMHDHHHWVRAAANELRCGGEILWQALCAEWVNSCLQPSDAALVTSAVEEALAKD